MKSKLFVLGLDGADFDMLSPLLESGKLPNIKRLMEEGTYGRLRSTVPPVTGPAWVSFMTGKNPGKTGIFDFVIENKEDGEKNLINSTSFQDDRFWDILGRHGYKTGLVSIPITYPPQKVNGFMITCLMTPSEESGYTYPKELKEEIRQMYRLNLDSSKYFDMDEKEFLKGLYEVTEKQFNTVRYLIKNKEWDFFMFVLSGTDFVQHFFYKNEIHPQHGYYLQYIYNYLKKVDEEIGKTLKVLGQDANIILMSDHGFGSAPVKFFHVNKWLLDKGFLKTKNKGVLASRTIPYDRLYDKLVKFGLGRLKALVPVKNRAFLYNYSKSAIDFDNSKAHYEGKNMAGVIKISKNLKAHEREALIKELIDGLSKIKDDEGKNVISNVWRAEDLYHGPHARNFGDVIVMFERDYYGKESLDTLFSSLDYRRSKGNHMMNGILVANGPLIKSGQEITGVEITDLAPTILSMYGISATSEMDGRVMKDIFNSPFSVKTPRRSRDFDRQKTELSDKIRKLRAAGRI